MPEVQISAFDAPEQDGAASADGVVAVSAPEDGVRRLRCDIVSARPVPDQLALLIVTVEPSAPAETPVAGTAAAVIHVLHAEACVRSPKQSGCGGRARAKASAVGEAEPEVALPVIVFVACVDSPVNGSPVAFASPGCWAFQKRLLASSC